MMGIFVCDAEEVTMYRCPVCKVLHENLVEARSCRSQHKEVEVKLVYDKNSAYPRQIDLVTKYGTGITYVPKRFGNDDE